MQKTETFQNLKGHSQKKVWEDAANLNNGPPNLLKYWLRNGI
jgi:hypothetical protein